MPKPVLVETGTPVVAALEKGGVQPRGGQNQFRHATRIVIAGPCSAPFLTRSLRSTLCSAVTRRARWKPTTPVLQSRVDRARTRRPTLRTRRDVVASTGVLVPRMMASVAVAASGESRGPRRSASVGVTRSRRRWSRTGSPWTSPWRARPARTRARVPRTPSKVTAAAPTRRSACGH